MSTHNVSFPGAVRKIQIYTFQLKNTPVDNTSPQLSHYVDSIIPYSIFPEILTSPFDYQVICLKDTGCVAKNVYLDQTVPLGTV